MRIKKKNVLKESYLINESVLLDQLTHIKPNVKKVLRLVNKKFVPKDKEDFYWWRLSQYDIEKFLVDEMSIPELESFKIAKFFVKYGERLFSESEPFIYDVPVKEVFKNMFSKYLRIFNKERNLFPDLEFNTKVNGKKINFTSPYDIWDGYNGLIIYLGYEHNINTSLTIRFTFDFEKGGENTILIKSSNINYDNQDGATEIQFLPKNTEINLPKDDSYESFVEWVQELINNSHTILSDINIKDNFLNN